MEQKDKELLLRYLSMALPYGVVLHFDDKVGQEDEPLYGFRENGGKLQINDAYFIEEVKPYLKPLSSMTDEEINEFILISDTVLWLGDKRTTCILSIEQMNWLNAHHFDFLGLIEKDLAIEVTEENNPYKD